MILASSVDLGQGYERFRGGLPCLDLSLATAYHLCDLSWRPWTHSYAWLLSLFVVEIVELPLVKQAWLYCLFVPLILSAFLHHFLISIGLNGKLHQRVFPKQGDPMPPVIGKVIVSMVRKSVVQLSPGTFFQLSPNDRRPLVLVGDGKMEWLKFIGWNICR